MRLLRLIVVGSLVCTTGLGFAQTDSSPLQIYTVTNTLSGWQANGLRDTRGNIVVAPGGTFTALQSGGYLRELDGHFFVYDAHGMQIAGPYDYLQLPTPHSEALIVGKNGVPGINDDLGGLIDDRGRELLPTIYFNVRYLKDAGLFTFQRARRWGLADAHGKILIQPLFDEVIDSPGAVAVQVGQQSGLVGLDGKYIVPIGPHAVQTIRGGADNSDYFSVCESTESSDATKCRYIDAHGHPVLEGNHYDDVSYYADLHRWTVTEPPQGDSADMGSYGPAALLDKDGNILIRLKCLDSGNQINRLGDLFVAQDKLPERKECTTGLLNPDGRWQIPPNYTSVRLLSDSDANQAEKSKSSADEYLVTQLGADDQQLYGVVDAHGNVLIKPAYQNITSRYSHLGLYLAELDGKWGVVDRAGQWRIPPTHTEQDGNANLPSTELIVFRDSGKHDDDDRYFLYNLQTGQPVSHEAFSYLETQTNAVWGKLGLPWEEYTVVTAMRAHGKTGVIDLKGKVLVPFEYDHIEAFDDWGWARATKNGKDLSIRVLDQGREDRLHAAFSLKMRSEFAPIPTSGSPFMGRFVPSVYTSKQAVQTAARQGRLKRPDAPMLLLDANTAIMDFGMVANKKLPFDYLEDYCARADGFEIPLRSDTSNDEACSDPKRPKLSFRSLPDNTFQCTTCTPYGLPEQWIRTDSAPNPALP